jgi:hypothetical protein
VKKEDCPKLQKGKQLQFFTKKKKKKTGIARECEECRSKTQTLGTLCTQIFVFSGATTERRNKRDKQRKQQQQQHKAGYTRARARELG